MGYPMQPAQVPGGGVFSAKGFLPSTGQTFIRGAVVLFDSGSVGNIKEVSATPTASILGVALQGAFTGPGNLMANAPATITTPNNYCTVAIADNVTVFQATMVNNSATRIPVLQSYVGVKYGISKQTDWCVDISLTGGSACVLVVEVDFMRNLALFKFIPAAIIAA